MHPNPQTKLRPNIRITEKAEISSPSRLFRRCPDSAVRVEEPADGCSNVPLGVGRRLRVKGLGGGLGFSVQGLGFRV